MVTILPIAVGWIRRAPDHDTIAMGVLPQARVATALTVRGWFWFACDAAGQFLGRR